MERELIKCLLEYRDVNDKRDKEEEKVEQKKRSQNHVTKVRNASSPKKYRKEELSTKAA